MLYRYLRLLLLVSCAALLASCATGAALRLEKLGGATLNDNYLSAIATIEKNGKKLYGKNNAFLYNMDIGVLFHYAGLYDSSNLYLLKANEIHDDLFAHSITNEAASFLINDNIRPYRSKPYELVLLHQFIALNFLALDNVDEALVESRQADLLMQELQRKDKGGEKYSTDGMFHYISSIAYDETGKTDDAMISLYKSIEAFKKGPVSLPATIRDYGARMLKKNDREEDVKRLELPDSVTDSKAAGPENGASEIVVIGYAGRGPVLHEDSWSGTFIVGGGLIMSHTGPDGKAETMTMNAPLLPAKEYEKATKGEKNSVGSTFHIKFSLPAEKQISSMTSYFTVSGPAIPTPVQTDVINDLDLQVGKSLADSRASTLGRTAVRVVLRTIAAQKAKEKMETNSPIANLLIGLGTDILADQLERADTRCCFLLPKTIQIARIPVAPGTYTIQTTAHNASGGVIGTKTIENIAVKKGQKEFVFVSSFR
jgi:uncharacterized protein